MSDLGAKNQIHNMFKFNGWNEIVVPLKGETISHVEVVDKNMRTYRVFFKFKLLVSDLGAKNQIHNMFKFNGYFGCHYCTVMSKTIGRTHSSYPFNQTGQIKEPLINDVYVNLAQCSDSNTLYNVAGVKGRSPFSSLIEGLPLSAPIDYMHCVILGVFPELLRLCLKELKADDKIKVNLVISNLSCPREIVSFSSKIRPLDELAQFKANENFNWLFYLSPVLSMDRLPQPLYLHPSRLSLGIRLVLESSDASNVNKSSSLLNKFCEEIVSIHSGNDRIETINVHCLKHFCWKVKRFGPLYCYSAMCFEAANRVLGDMFSGSHSELEVICRRVLQR